MVLKYSLVYALIIGICIADTEIVATLKDGDVIEYNGVEYEPLTKLSPSSVEFYVFAGLCVVLVCIAGIVSGLTVGLFSIDPLKLELLKSDKKQAAMAEKLRPILSNHHLLLVTLLVTNAACMETLPIFLDELVPSYIAVILSVCFVLIFGEIVPQALCTSQPLKIGSFFAPFVRFLIMFTYPVSYPMSKLLDRILGHNEANSILFKPSELQMIIELQKTTDHENFKLSSEKAAIMQGALNIGEKTVKDVMTKMENVFMLDVNTKLDFEVLVTIFKYGFSRIPCYHKHDDGTVTIVGILMVRDLILVDPDDEIEVGTVLNVLRHDVSFVFPDRNLQELLRDFREMRTHIAIVHDVAYPESGDPYYRYLGLVTFEDILEEILQEHIIVDRHLSYGNELIENSLDPEEKTSYGPRSTLHRLKIFNTYSKRMEMQAKLAIDESRAVFFHLSGCVGALFGIPYPMTKTGLEHVVANSVLLTLDRKEESPRDLFNENVDSSLDAIDISQGGYSLYKYGEPSEYLTLIISGKVVVRSGKNRFETTLCSWNVLGLDAFDGIAADSKFDLTFDPDFSAHAKTSVRILRISRKLYYEGLCGGYSSDVNPVIQMVPVVSRTPSRENGIPKHGSDVGKYFDVEMQRAGDSKHFSKRYKSADLESPSPSGPVSISMFRPLEFGKLDDE